MSRSEASSQTVTPDPVEPAWNKPGPAWIGSSTMVYRIAFELKKVGSQLRGIVGKMDGNHEIKETEKALDILAHDLVHLQQDIYRICDRNDLDDTVRILALKISGSVLDLSSQRKESFRVNSDIQEVFDHEVEDLVRIRKVFETRVEAQRFLRQKQLTSGLVSLNEELADRLKQLRRVVSSYTTPAPESFKPVPAQARGRDPGEGSSRHSTPGRSPRQQARSSSSTSSPSRRRQG